MRCLYLFLLSFSLLSCGPSFTSPVLAPEISIDQMVLPKLSAAGEGRFYLKNFQDSRTDKNLLKINGEVFSTDSDLTLVVREGISRAFVKAGYAHSKEASVFIAGKLEQWDAEIVDAYPSTILCKAKIYLELLDPIDRRIYSGTYSGMSELQSPGLNNDDLRKALSLAMNKAVEQAVKDKGLTSIINAY